MIDKTKILQYLGTKGKSDGFTDLVIDDMIVKTEKHIEPKIFYKIFDIKNTDGKIEVLNTTIVFAGKSINLRLKDCNRCVIFYATLGYEIDKKIKELQRTSLSEALVMNACASAALEDVCDNLCKNLSEEFLQNTLTKRFSPGYGDLSLEYNKEILNVLNGQRQAGIVFNQGGLMTPTKSVTAIVGIKQRG